MELSPDELIRFSRHLKLPDFGPGSQIRLKKAKVLVTGAGGLGAPLLQYLTAAGVGTIGVLDYDTVEQSNLQRQVLYDMNDLNKPKSKTAIEKLHRQNPTTEFIDHQIRLTASNAMDIVSQYDVVADGTDNFPTRYLVNDTCVLLGKPWVYGSIYQYEGQVSVFNKKQEDGQRGPDYRDLYPTPPAPDLVPDCSEGGVLGVLPGIIGSIQALEVIKLLTGVGDSLSGRLFLFDALHFSTRLITIKKDPSNPVSGLTPTITELIDYEDFCGIHKENDNDEWSVEKLKDTLEDGDTFLLDVREQYEYDAGNIGGNHIPLSQLVSRISEVPENKNVVVYCRSGRRSLKAIDLLKNEARYTHLFNLKGGLLAWKDRIDPTIIVV